MIKIKGLASMKEINWRKLNPALFFKEGFFFLLVQLAGLWIARRLFFVPEIRQQLSQTSEASAVSFLIIFAFATGIFLILLYFLKRSRLFFKTLMILALFLGIEISLSAFLQESWAVFLALGAVVVYLIVSNILLHNFLFSIALAGTGALLGITFDPKTSMVLLLVLALYDIGAVYLTKHMVKMAKAMTRSGAVLGIVIPQTEKGYFQKLSQVRPGEGGFYFIGGGDLALPLLLVAAVGKTSPEKGLVVALFALLGLLGTHLLFVSQDRRRPLPALPMIALGSFLGYLVARL